MNQHDHSQSIPQYRPYATLRVPRLAGRRLDDGTWSGDFGTYQALLAQLRRISGVSARDNRDTGDGRTIEITTCVTDYPEKLAEVHGILAAMEAIGVTVVRPMELRAVITLGEMPDGFPVGWDITEDVKRSVAQAVGSYGAAVRWQ